MLPMFRLPTVAPPPVLTPAVQANPPRMKMPRLVVLAFIAALFTRLPAVAADNAVLTWNEQALNAIRLARTPPPIASHHLAAFHAAIYDAVNGITRTHQPWQGKAAAPDGANMDAAIASASITVLNALWGQAANPQNYQAAYDLALKAIPDGQAKTDGIAFGKQIAEAVLAARAKSGWNKPIEGVFSSSEPGLWRETPPGFRPPVLPHWANVTPYVMKSPDQFRAPPPPAVDSQQAADEMEQIARIGARDNAQRTEYETLAAPFWADDLGSATPPGHWNVIAQDLTRRNKLSTAETARLFALLNLACADAGITIWETKFHYRTWRPETSIREVTKEINPHATAHPDFIPLMVTPAFPSYISGHSTFSAAASRILERYFRSDDIEFTTTSDGLPGAVRTFKKLSDCRNEVGMSRLWGGIHVMVDNLKGQEAGIKVADYVYDNALQPTRDWTKP